MRSRLKYLIVSLYLSLFVFAQSAQASLFSNGLDSTAEVSGQKGANKLSDFPVTIGLIIKIVLSFVGVVFMAMIIYAGFLWMMAAGKNEDVDKAKKIIEQSIIGLIIITLAYAITQYATSVIK